jgi:hypothetical protein
MGIFCIGRQVKGQLFVLSESRMLKCVIFSFGKFPNHNEQMRSDNLLDSENRHDLLPCLEEPRSHMTDSGILAQRGLDEELESQGRHHSDVLPNVAARRDES